MPGKHAACDGNGIEAHFARAQPRPLREEVLGRSGNACLLARHQGFHGIDKRIARLDFNETDYPRRPRRSASCFDDRSEGFCVIRQSPCVQARARRFHDAAS